MEKTDRRQFNAQALGAFVTWSLLETLSGSEALAKGAPDAAAKWIQEMDRLGRDVKGQAVTQVVWQEKIEELFSQIKLDELLQFVDFKKLTTDIQLVDNGARSLRFSFPKVEGLPKDLVFGKQIFAVKKGRSVVPHGHNNMATAFLVMNGKLHGRHYDRLQDEKDHFIIRPTIDREFKPGEYSTVSDYKDNIHWFKATTEPAYLFNIHVLDVRPGSKLPTGRVYVDPNGESIEGGLVRARRIGYKESHDLFG